MLQWKFLRSEAEGTFFTRKDDDDDDENAGDAQDNDTSGATVEELALVQARMRQHSREGGWDAAIHAAYANMASVYGWSAEEAEAEAVKHCIQLNAMAFK